MATLAELYVRLEPYDASESEYRRLGERIYEAAVSTAERAYRGDVTVEVTITEGSAKIKLRVMQAIVILDLAYGRVADWKSFKEQAVSTYESSVTFLKSMGETVPQVAHVSPRQVKRLDKRYKAAGKLKELVEAVDQIRQPMLAGESLQPLLRRIQQLAIEVEHDLTEVEKKQLSSLISNEVPDISDMPTLVTAHAPKSALRPSAPELPPPPGFIELDPKPKRRKTRVVFHKTTLVPGSRRLLR